MDMGDTATIELFAQAGEVIALLASAVIIVRTLVPGAVQIGRMWRDAAKERNRIAEESEAARRELDERQLRVLDTMVNRLTELDTAQSEVKTLLDGARREHTTIIGSLVSDDFGLAALSKKIDGLPKQTAGAVRAELKEDLEKIRNAAASVTLSIDSLVSKLDALPVASADNHEVREAAAEAAAEPAGDESGRDSIAAEAAEEQADV